MEDLLAHGSLRTKVKCQSRNLDGIQGKVLVKAMRQSGKGRRLAHGSLQAWAVSTVSKAASTVSRPNDRQQ